MAKLDGVKTLDMVNGEITKVAYGGAEYVKAEGLPKMGDLVLADKGGYDITYGAFYKITEDADHEDDVRFLDDVDDGRVRDLDDYVLFRKVSVSTNPSLEERVSTTESEIESLKSDGAALKGEPEYKRVDADEAEVGDYVKFIKTEDPSITVGKMYEIVDIDYEGYLDFIDDDGSENCGIVTELFEVYRKVSAASAEAEPKPERLKVGDYAKVVNDSRDYEVEIGTIVLVTIIDDAAPSIKCDDLSGNRIGWFFERELIRATDEEVAEAKDAAARAKFKRGDKVRLISGGGDYPLSGFENDKIYEVLYNNFNHPKGKRIRIADSTERFGYATPDQIEILTEEEAAEIERKQAAEAKWAKIGRKVGEYRVGDIVLVTDSGSSMLKTGDIGAVSELSEVSIRVNVRNIDKCNWVSRYSIELITPVEARFDR